jgi:hypothetical protein
LAVSRTLIDDDGNEYEPSSIVCPQCGEVVDYDADSDQAETGDLVDDAPCDLCIEAEERHEAMKYEGDR